jgi:glycerol-3-phosphate dehydrogenase
MFFENKDGRITLFFALGDKVMAGTTDIPVDDPDQVEVTDDEIEYIIEAMRIVFPDIHVDRSQIVFWFTGVRPLPRQDAATTGQISRDHRIEITPPGDGVSFPVYSLIGGKWTTFRAFAEQTADKLLPLLNRQRQASTARLAFGGGVGYPRGAAARARWVEVVAGKTGLNVERVETLFERYGTRAAEIGAYIQAAPDAPLAHVPGYTRREVLFLAERERIVHLDDLLLRRSLLAMLGHISAASLDELAAVLAEPLGWTPEQAAAEAGRAFDLLTQKNGMRLARAVAPV